MDKVDLNYLEHEFEVYRPYLKWYTPNTSKIYVCVKCNCQVVFSKNICLDINNINFATNKSELKLNCGEYIIKNILE